MLIGDDLRGEEGHMNDIHLRAASPQDAPAMTALIASLTEWFSPAEVETVREVIGPPGVVAVDGAGTIIGFLVWEQRPDEWEICWIAVARDQHRRGLGRRMLRWTVERACREGVSRIRVQTVAATSDYEPYVGTRAFYDACGFELDSIESQGWPDGLDKGIYVLRLPVREKEQE
jgi:GNAT superfamily N-acetyltransferase